MGSLDEGSDEGCQSPMPGGTTCTPMCDPGYGFAGDMVVASCDLGNYTTPDCEPLPCDMSAPPHGDRGDCPAVLESGGSCVQVCHPWHHFESNSSCSLGNETHGICGFDPYVPDSTCMPSQDKSNYMKMSCTPEMDISATAQLKH